MLLPSLSATQGPLPAVLQGSNPDCACVSGPASPTVFTTHHDSSIPQTGTDPLVGGTGGPSGHRELVLE